MSNGGAERFVISMLGVLAEGRGGNGRLGNHGDVMTTVVPVEQALEVEGKIRELVARGKVKATVDGVAHTVPNQAKFGPGYNLRSNTIPAFYTGEYVGRLVFKRRATGDQGL